MTTAGSTFRNDKLTIVVTYGEKNVRVVFRGESDARDPAPFISQVTKTVLPKLTGKQVTVDFRQLEYMNSATVSSILTLIRSLDEHQITTTLNYDMNVHWQRVNFNCMKVIARSMRYVVDVVGN